MGETERAAPYAGQKADCHPKLLIRAQPFGTKLGNKDKSSSEAGHFSMLGTILKGTSKKKPATKTSGVQQEHDLSASTEGS